MSVASQLTRLQTLKGTVRTKLIALGIISDSSATLDDCATAINNITNNAAVSATLDISTKSYTIPAGYHNGSGAVALTTEVKTATPSGVSQDIVPSAGKVLEKVTVDPISASYANVSGVTAVEANVLAPKLFVKANGQQVAGSMVDNGAVAATINGTTVTSYTVPAGYHSGAGTVSLTNDIETALAAL
jgi:hypothetical protein